jgi:peptidoglycan hydrolase CwlO-like protein
MPSYWEIEQRRRYAVREAHMEWQRQRQISSLNPDYLRFERSITWGLQKDKGIISINKQIAEKRKDIKKYEEHISEFTALIEKTKTEIADLIKKDKELDKI